MFLAVKGLFLATLRGTGVVYLQSLPFPEWLTESSRALHLPVEAEREKGSVLGAIGGLLDGDNR